MSNVMDASNVMGVQPGDGNQPRHGGPDAGGWAAIARASGGRPFRDHRLPATTPVPAVNAAMDKWRELVDQYDAAQTRTLSLDGAVAAAVAADTEALADANEAGKKDPGTPAADALAQETADAKRQTAALVVAVQRADAELVKVLDANRAKIRAATDRAIDKRTARVRELIAEIRTETDALADDQRLREFAGKPLDRWRGKSWGKPLQVGRDDHGNPVTAGDMLDDLTAAISPDPPGPVAA